MNSLTSNLNKRAGKVILAQLLAYVLFVFLPNTVFAQSYSGPLVITKGGTYKGNWESKDSEVAAVEIRTSEPVIIENSNIRGAGYLIKSWGYSVNLTVRHTNGYGNPQTPYKDYKKPRRFVTVNNFQNLVVENCYMESTAGIYAGTRYEGDNTPNEAIKIRYNVAKNIDGRVYGGDKEHSQFVQFNFKGAIKYAEIAWNQVMNEADKSLVEDNINIYNTRGMVGNPIRIHNNFIQGAYPAPSNGTKYSGGGIITDGDAGINDCPAYIEAYENQLVGLGNYSMGIAGGNNIRYHHNRAINAATFDNGSKYSMYTSGLWSKDYYKHNTTFANSIDNNVVGIVAWGYTNNRNDISVAENAEFISNTFLPNPISKQSEKDEFTMWQSKLSKNGIVLGPNGSGGSSTTTPAPTPTPTPTPAPTTPSTPVAGGGKITHEFWANVSGGSVNDIPVSQKPTSTKELDLFEAPANVGDNYGQRIRGYITAPESGQYTFWVAGDNNAELYLSTSENPADKKRLAYVNGWTNPREWAKYGTQQSAKVTLEKGKRYYIEALGKEEAGGDNLAVAWQMPNGTKEAPIAGNRLAPMGSSAPVATTPEPTPAPTPTPTPTPTPAPTTPSTPVAGNGKITHEFWANVSGSSVNDIPVSQKPTSTKELDLFEAPANVGDNFGQRIRGYITAPESGQYTFWVAGDNNAELYLSTSENPADKKRLAYVNGWTNPREWAKYGTQQSAKVTLEKGKRYYIEALGKEEAGGDNLAVAWQMPNGTKEAPIAGNRLAPMGSSAPVATTPEPTPAPTPTPAPAPTTGKITHEFWANVGGSNVTDIPVSQKPTSTKELDLFEAPANVGDNYGQRIRGYITAPESGQYTFWVAGDNNAELYLSTSENPADKKRLAYVNGWTNPREWAKYGTQQSAKVTLEKGKRYYIEALGKEEAGGDNLAVAWQMPNGTKEAPIAGNRLSPIQDQLLNMSATQVSKATDSNPFFAQTTAYPNPFRDVVTLDFGDNKVELEQVVVLSQTGSVVYEETKLTLVNNKLSLHLADLKTGLYILKYTDKAGHSDSIKIVKE